MRLCVVTMKHTWQDGEGRWVTDGGFPFQVAAISAPYSETTLVLVRVPPRSGGMRLPARARVVPLRSPVGQDLRRKVSVVLRLPYYLAVITREVWRADVVHIPVPGDISILGLLVAQTLRKRLSVRYCGSWVTNSTTTWMNRVTRWWMQRTAGGRNVMLATGEGSKPPAPGMHWVFATAVSARELEAARPDLTRGPSTPLRLVFIGRLSFEKGVNDLIDAVARLRERGVAADLTVLGDGADRPALEAQARALGLRVTFTGQVDRESLGKHLMKADLCVQPSLSEGFSKAWLDALAHGVPVIASDVGAAASVIGAAGERGWLVEPGSVDQLVSRIEGALKPDVGWPGLRRRCRTFAEARTLEAWGRRISDLCAAQWQMPVTAWSAP